MGKKRTPKKKQLPSRGKNAACPPLPPTAPPQDKAAASIAPPKDETAPLRGNKAASPPPPSPSGYRMRLTLLWKCCNVAWRSPVKYSITLLLPRLTQPSFKSAPPSPSTWRTPFWTFPRGSTRRPILPSPNSSWTWKKTTKMTNTCQLVLVEEKDKPVIVFRLNLFSLNQSKKISNDQELMQSDPTSCPQKHKLTAVYERHSR